MPIIEQFDRNMIKRILEKRGFNYSVDERGDYQVRFDFDSELGCEVLMIFSAVGEHNKAYHIQILNSKQIQKEKWGKAMMACNRWNSQWLWPRAYLQFDDSDAATAGEIVLDASIDLKAGVHQELLETFTNNVAASAADFLEWLQKEQGL